mmetsp:Transcript_18138/g.32845  ORF Transcript_18138/g.32845 Transcript_18138/m.32845 type:complete len:264 (+) Transcript_18138:182-973(+)
MLAGPFRLECFDRHGHVLNFYFEFSILFECSLHGFWFCETNKAKSSIIGSNRRLLNGPKRLERLDNKIMTLRQIIRLPHPRDHQRRHGQLFQQIQPEDGCASVDYLGPLEGARHAEHDCYDDSVEYVLKVFVYGIQTRLLITPLPPIIRLAQTTRLNTPIILRPRPRQTLHARILRLRQRPRHGQTHHALHLVDFLFYHGAEGFEVLVFVIVQFVAGAVEEGWVVDFVVHDVQHGIVVVVVVGFGVGAEGGIVDHQIVHVMVH